MNTGTLFPQYYYKQRFPVTHRQTAFVRETTKEGGVSVTYEYAQISTFFFELPIERSTHLTHKSHLARNCMRMMRHKRKKNPLDVTVHKTKKGLG